LEKFGFESKLSDNSKVSYGYTMFWFGGR
jgi:hypothetical protein